MTNAQKLIDTGVVDIPWPSMIDGWLHLGTRFQESAICKERCKTKECRQAQGKSVELVCNQGLTYYQLSLAGHTIIVYGVTGSDKSHLPKYPQLKLQLKGRTVTREEFMNWSARLHALFDTLETVEKELLSQVLHPLHDTMRVAGEVREIAGKIVEKDRHKSFEENFESSPREVKSLFKAADMLVDTFDSAAIYFNPEAAKYGKPRDVEVYKLLDKLRLIMNTAGVSRVRNLCELVYLKSCTAEVINWKVAWVIVDNGYCRSLFDLAYDISRAWNPAPHIVSDILKVSFETLRFRPLIHLAQKNRRRTYGCDNSSGIRQPTQ